MSAYGFGSLYCYHVGYWINRYAGWYRIRHFAEPIDLVRWLIANGDAIEAIDFVVFRID